ncbi:hypothetical protein DP939_09335 [Spongiactinospora rosea]|uniref:Hint domain-containing protein n=2 Tax=Spongiactinospora rosea TaxID=2248750 RepID=A0A366M363_9ACTN|nr:hypothetical protein DP939_09335 [Spongiactinospora rosea]
MAPTAPEAATAAAKAAREAATKRAAAKAAADALAKKLVAEAAAKAKAMAAKAKAKTKPKAPDPKSRGTNGGDRAKRSSCANSFAVGTPILLANGTAKPIEKVDLGERVMVTDPETGQTATKPVVRQIAGEGEKNLITLTIDTDGDRGTATGELVATDGHPIWVQGERAWLNADQLKTGMWLRTSAGTYVQITEIGTSTT